MVAGRPNGKLAPRLSGKTRMCGFISVFGPDGSDVIQEVLTGLLAIQHRGQDAAGVVTYRHKFEVKKGLGLVRDVFAPKHMTRLRGSLAVGHVRYPTVGTGDDSDVQPFVVPFPVPVAMAHNGNVTNYQELKRSYFPARGVPLASSCDLEAVLYVFAGKLIELGSRDPEAIREAVAEVFAKVKGAYSVAGILGGDGMFAFRDPFGIKPAILGKREGPDGTSWAVASESVVLDVTGYEVVRDLRAGEAIWIGTDRKLHSMQVGDRPHRPCIFEHIYFARPDATLDRISVYKARRRLGERLAHAWQQTGLEADVVIPVPESSCTAAQTMAEALGLPYREGFVKNRYVGRTFIMPNDQERRDSVRHKLNPIRVEFEGKRVLILDDSIVRGNTSKQIVRIARQMGASKVYLASYSAPLKFPCPYGIDMSTKREFVARDRDRDAIARELGCDYVLYQTIDDMVDAVRWEGDPETEFCKACFDGRYPTGDVTEKMLSDIEDERLAAAKGAG
jgi:amidophosphoribosyltransferase